MKQSITSTITVCVLLISGLLICSCKKSADIDDTGKYYMRFSVDGTRKEFTATTAFLYDKYTCSLNGGSNDSTGNAFTINIYSLAPLAENVVYTQGSEPPTRIPTSYLSYAVNSRAYYNYSSWIPSSIVTDCQVQFSKIDSSYVKGTFSGVVKERYGSAQLKITEGEFLLERKKI